MKVVWLCNFSNSKVRENMNFSKGVIDSLLRRITKSNEEIQNSDFGQWITNAIEEIEYNNEIELHVISPHYRLKGLVQEFRINNVYYHFFADESYSFVWKIISKCGFKKKPQYRRNCRTITRLVQKINPDLLHLVGVENINYSSYILNAVPKIPLIVQLQTLVNDPKVYSALSERRDHIKDIETQILKKADYIFTTVPSYISIIRNSIAPNAVILANTLAVGMYIDKKNNQKDFDFVYFSVNINKAADLAVEAFAIAKQEFPKISLDIIGYYSQEYKSYLDEIIKKHNLTDSVFFEGRLPTHNDVMRQVKKARFALLPLRPDVLPSTIREAMALGCPVITTITPSTPMLNKNRLSVMLSEPESPISIASNMYRLLSDSNLCSLLRENAFLTVQEKYDNKAIMEKVLYSYNACLDNYYNKTPIPASLL